MQDYRIVTFPNGNQAILDDDRLIPFPAGGAPEGDDEKDDKAADDKAAGDKNADDGEKAADEGAGAGKGADDKEDPAAAAAEARFAKLEQALADRDARLKVFEDERTARENERLAREGRDPASIREAEIDEAFRRRIERVYGPGANETLETLRDAHERQAAQHARDAQNHMLSELEEHGIEVPDDKTRTRWELALGTELRADPELLGQFQNPMTQREAIREAFARVRDGLINPITATMGGRKLERMAKRRDAVLGGEPRRGGGPAPDRKPPTPPADLKDPDAVERWYKNHMFGELDTNLGDGVAG